MKAVTVLLLALGAILCAAGALAETVAGLPVHIQKYQTGAIRVWLGDHISSTATVAIPTAKGVVIIDTTGNPAVDRELRRIIARELGRDDFAMLINTHEHGDHTGGNAVYADCRIVGHELVAAGMERASDDRDRIIDWMTGRIAELEEQMAGLAGDDPQKARLKEDLILNKLELDHLQNPTEPVPPTKTFADRLELDMGDTDFELIYIGGMHSASDIAIWVPQHGLVMTGDTMADVWLTDTPGCLASFGARPGIVHDFPRMLKNWNYVLGLKDRIQTLVPGHWNGELTYAGSEARVRYVEELWDGARKAAADGTDLQAMLADYALSTRFPHLVDSPGCDGRSNYSTILEMWGEATGQRSAADVLYELVDRDAGAEEIGAVLAQKGTAGAECFFIESQINAYGYRFLFQEMPQKAAVLFRANAELYPESWNAYDSLGEALLACGEREEGIAMYRRSLQINPENANGKAVLERLAAETSVN